MEVLTPFESFILITLIIGAIAAAVAGVILTIDAHFGAEIEEFFDRHEIF